MRELKFASGVWHAVKTLIKEAQKSPRHKENMEFDLIFFAFAIPAVIFAGISKGGFGSGAAFAATPLLAIILTPGQAIGLMLPLLMLMDLSALKPYWRKWDWPNARVLILGAAPGVLVGALIYRVTDPDVFRLLIGSVAIGFVGFQLARKLGWLHARKRVFNPWSGGFWGFVAGVTSFISHAGGPPVAVHMLSQDLGKTAYQSTTVITFWMINWFKFVPYFLLGIFSTQTALADLILAPFAVLGVILGVHAQKVMPEKVFFAVTYVLLTLTGTKLIFDGLT